MMRAALLVAIVVSLGLTGCVTRPDPILAAKRFDFISVGQTTRERLILELGAPTSTFETERISVWQYRLMSGNLWRLLVRVDTAAPLDEMWAEYSLVVVFEPDGTVARWKLVSLNQPAVLPAAPMS